MWLHNLNPQWRHTGGKVWAEAPSGWGDVWMRQALWCSTGRVNATQTHTEERGRNQISRFFFFGGGWRSWEREPSAMPWNTRCKYTAATSKSWITVLFKSFESSYLMWKTLKLFSRRSHEAKETFDFIKRGICHAKATLIIQARISSEHSYTSQLAGTCGARDIQLGA